MGESKAYVYYSPEYITSDFELAAINASKHEFSSSKTKGCLFRLCENVWRKLHGLGLFIEYGVNENVSIKVGTANVISCIFPEEEIRYNFIFKEMKDIFIPCNVNNSVGLFED